MQMVRSIKTRAGGTMTESAFWGTWIRSALRQKSRWRPPISQTRKAAERKSQSDNKRLKYEYQCSICKQWFNSKEIEVDHITPAGTLTCANDLPGFVERLFVEKEGLQCLCKNCHHNKTHILSPNKKKGIKNL